MYISHAINITEKTLHLTWTKSTAIFHELLANNGHFNKLKTNHVKRVQM